MSPLNSHPSRPQPPAWRLLLGLVLAPLLPAVLFSLIESGDLGSVWLAAVFGGYPAAIVLGIPAYLLLRNRVEPRVGTLMLVGGLIAMAPWLLLSLVSGADQAAVGNCVTVIDGRRTWCGYLSMIDMLARIFAYGAIGGLAFWICAVWRGMPSEAGKLGA